MFDKILMICSANICRSPMAEGFANHYLAKAFPSQQFHISSAGIWALVDKPPVPHACTVMKEVGIDISDYKGRQLDRHIVNDQDLILVMENFHRTEIVKKYPNAQGKTHLLGKWGNKISSESFELADFHDESVASFRDNLNIIEQGWLAWQEKLFA